MSENAIPIKELAFGFVIGLVTYWGQAAYPNADPALSAGISWLAGLITFSISMQFAGAKQIQITKESALDALVLAKKAMRAGIINHSLTERHASLSKMDSVIQDVSFTALENALFGLQVDYENSFAQIPGRRLSLISYTAFWNFVLNIQRDTEIRLIGLMTHSSDIDIFTDEITRNLNSIQSRFAESNGFLFRIFIDKSIPTRETIIRYIAMIQYLDTCKIVCMYVNVYHENLFRGDYESQEFCIINKIEYTADWILRGNNELSALVVSTNPEIYKNNYSKWSKLIRHSKATQFEYIADEIIRQQVDLLRNTFFSKYSIATRKTRFTARKITKNV
jgi:hypothetical protein